MVGKREGKPREATKGGKRRGCSQPNVIMELKTTLTPNIRGRRKERRTENEKKRAREESMNTASSGFWGVLRERGREGGRGVESAARKGGEGEGRCGLG